MINAAELNAYIGRNINTICGNGYTNAADNHCAHFISHALAYTINLPREKVRSWPIEQQEERLLR